MLLLPPITLESFKVKWFIRDNGINMSEKKFSEQNWTHEQLRSLLNAMKQRSIIDAQVDYYDDSLHDKLRTDDEPQKILPVDSNK